jgi:UDP-N-acetylmuramoyl-tripeptide--D-alanyl-D-alanine ligase
MQIERLYARFTAFPKVQTDTRSLQPGEIFFALKGPHFNGNQFARKALDAGAAAVVIDEPVLEQGPDVFLVDHALKALQELALHHRKQFDIPFIAITGSNGKTTTKELVHAVLSSTYRTYTTKGNLNNHIGVPLTILSIKKDAEMAIIEMGANHQKEIEGYCAVALPTHGLITNCGKAHMEGFGGVEGIKKGKGELFDFLGLEGGTAFINSDLDYLDEMSAAIGKKIYYGSKKGDLRCSVLQQDPLLAIETTGGSWGKQRIFTRLVGNYNKPNIEAAICIGLHFQVPFDRIRSALESYLPENARSQLLTRGNNKIILDAYNANPTSMLAALDNFRQQHEPNKWLLLGGMMELGEDSVKEHQELTDAIQKTGIKNVVLVGGDFSKTKHPFPYFDDTDKAGKWIKNNTPEHALILIKGSRSMKMEALLDVL